MKEKNQALNTLNSPYFVTPSQKVKKAITYALKNGLLQKYNISKKILQEYLKDKTEIPFWIVEAVCKVNLQNINIPAPHQYIWFCLHNSIIKREQPSGRKFNTKVNFSSSYLNLTPQLKQVLEKSIKTLNCKLYEFNILCGYKKAISKNNPTIPLIAILKICQILNLNVWKLIANNALFSKTQKKGKIIIPPYKASTTLLVILAWIRTEGHVDLGSTHIEINQKNDLKSLRHLRKLLIKTFQLQNKISFFRGSRGEDRMIISSSPLKQILCLKYGIPPGYKSGALRKTCFNNLNLAAYQKIMASFVQTEGCLSYQYTRGKKKCLPKFEFIVKDLALAIDCKNVLEKMGFHPHFKENKNLFKVYLTNSNKVIEMINQIKPHLFNKKKIEYLKRKCTNGIGL